ncbi:D-alanine--D-alanine ligase family protein [Nigerium massiliense]|uniref:D-alanine--D-alanine ligase family protein n=1 Tax=Nigerium massiliense TaxID=1522317 RepID=UPI00058D5AD4|nr:D-alanine--D-alanine ligase family protein [Nigerium massiliense]
MPSAGRVRVAIIFGGVSSEHDVSCLTAGGVMRAIDEDAFEVVGIGITPTGRWVQVTTDEMKAFDIVDGTLPRLGEERDEAVLLRHGGEGTGRVATLDGDSLVNVRDFDVAFALLHGPFGEDGTIQGLFEMFGVRYVGSGVAASANSMDKDLMKRQLAGAGLPVCPWITVTQARWQRDQAGCREAADELSYPVYVKPARGGSSMGISRAETPEDLVAAVEEALRFDPKVIVEEGFVGAREVELAVLGSRDGAPPRVSVAGEIAMHTASGFYDFVAKYTPKDEVVTLHVPAEVDADLLARLQKIAGATFTAMGAEGLARVDLFVLPDGSLFVNELNTMPGFTRTSMYPSLWAQSGIPYADLIAELILLAVSRPLGLR